MHLSDGLRAELERRLALIEREQREDPAFSELPAADVAWLLVVVVVAAIGIVLLQVG